MRATLAECSEHSCDPHGRAGKRMEETEVHVNPAGIEEQLASLIEGAVAHYGLQIRLRGTIRTYPGSQHSCTYLHSPSFRLFFALLMQMLLCLTSSLVRDLLEPCLQSLLTG